MGAIAEFDAASPLAIPGRTIARQVAWLAAPVLVEQGLLYLITLSDTILAGHYLSEAHLAAVTNAGYLLWFLGSVIIVVSAGATALVARRIGAGRRRAARRVCEQAIGLAWIVGLLTMAVGYALAPAIAR